MKAKPLGKVRGIIASAGEESRNGRKYTENFWDSIFDSELFKEGLRNKVMIGELWHPDDDKEYGQIHADPTKAAVVLTKVEKKGLDYFGEFEILPTIAGETYKNLTDIGCVFGVSSRGYNDFDATVFDDPSTYELITFDLVAFPGIKSARLHPITAVAESFSKRKMDKEKIMKNLNKISEQDVQAKEYIESTLKTKEDFDSDVQADELDIFDGINDELKNYAIVVTFNSKNRPIYDDGINGLKVVKTTIQGKEGDKYLVDDIYYDEHTDTYTAVGDWLKLN